MKIPLSVFLRFLRKEKCLNSYIDAMKKDKKLHYNDCPLLEYMHCMNIIDNNKKCNEDSIVESFDWEEFPLEENNDCTWSDISEKWKTFIKYEEGDN
jgi:hypothetical protein